MIVQASMVCSILLKKIEQFLKGKSFLKKLLTSVLKFRIWWLAVFICCVIACTVSVYKIYIKWDQSAIIVNPANKETSLFTIPFPAVTICLESIFGRNKPNYEKLLKEIEEFKKSGNTSE